MNWTTSAIRDGSTNPIAKTWTLHLGRGEHLRPWRNKRRVEGWMDLPSLIWRNREVVGGSRGVDFDQSVLRWKSCVPQTSLEYFFSFELLMSDGGYNKLFKEKRNSNLFGKTTTPKSVSVGCERCFRTVRMVGLAASSLEFHPSTFPMDDARGECNQITYGDMPLPLLLFLMRMRDYDAMRQFQSVVFFFTFTESRRLRAQIILAHPVPQCPLPLKSELL